MKIENCKLVIARKTRFVLDFGYSRLPWLDGQVSSRNLELMFPSRCLLLGSAPRPLRRGRTDGFPVYGELNASAVSADRYCEVLAQSSAHFSQPSA